MNDDDHVLELEAVGLLVAGALTPGERVGVTGHLRTCQTCRDELVEVAALPGLLRRLGDEQPTPPLPTLARARLVTAAQTHTRHQRRHRQLVVGAALMLPVLLAGLLLASRPGPAPEPARLVAMQRAVATVDVDGSLATARRSWGTEVHVQVRWARQASAVLVAIGRDGTEQQAGAWAAPADEVVRCTGATSMAPEAVARWEVRTQAGAPLLVLQA